MITVEYLDRVDGEQSLTRKVGRDAFEEIMSLIHQDRIIEVRSVRGDETDVNEYTALGEIFIEGIAE